MSGLQRWSLVHDCHLPRVPTPDGVFTAESRWRCPTCGQAWRIIVHGTSQEARRIPLFYPNLRKRLWRRQVLREAEGRE